MKANTSNLLTLTVNETQLQVSAYGGSVLHFTHAGKAVLRPSPSSPVDVIQTANFPLVPFCNRIGGAKFRFQGRDISLNPDPAEPNALHGHGWRRTWQVADQSAQHVTLTYRHKADDWPWDYESFLTYRLGDGLMRAELGVKNLSATDMPSGLGFHPYFELTDDTRLKAFTDGVWENDDNHLPTVWHDTIWGKDWSQGPQVKADTTLNLCYTGFKDILNIYERDQHTITVTAAPECKYLHLYVPVGERYFCAEPVSHRPDPFVWPDSGMIALKSGQSQSVWMEISALQAG